MSEHRVSQSPDQAPDQTDEFFVGYRSVPARLSGFLRLLLPVVLIGAAMIGAGLASQQKDPGGGAWEVGRILTLRGIASSEPYALIRVRGLSSGEPVRTFLLVSRGKFGAAVRMRPFHHQAVQLMETLLHRDDRWMLELSDDPQAIQLIPEAVDLQRELVEASRSRAVGHLSLRGEIIDPKCYIGAMKPGGGKTHKACAQLCVGGGIPPMLVTRDAQRRETFYLLTASNGGVAGAEILACLGDPVEVSGHLERRGDLWVFRLDANGIHRL